MSAKNAWGTSTGYADELMQSRPGMDSARAQQLENWHQQREIQAQKNQQRMMTEQFDNVQQNAEADWRTLAKFGVERNQVSCGYLWNFEFCYRWKKRWIILTKCIFSFIFI